MADFCMIIVMLMLLSFVIICSIGSVCPQPFEDLIKALIERVKRKNKKD